MRLREIVVILLLGSAVATARLYAQAPAGGGARGGARGAAPTTGYPQRPPGDAAAVERGKALYSTSCAFCHGNDARGAEDGSNLLRSEIVLNDDKGELLADVIRNGAGQMPKFDFSTAQISDIAAFLHSFRVNGYDLSRNRPATIIVGDPEAGEAYFKAHCSSCHSAAGDLKGYGARFRDGRTLQQTWLMPGARGTQPSKAPVTTATITMPSGEKVSGPLIRIDDFFVTISDTSATQRTFRRTGDIPHVEIHDPLQQHKDLLRIYGDRDIHNITAYLDSLK